MQSSQFASGTEHILVVDDDREIGALLSKFLARHHYRVTVATNGKTMFEALTGATIDLVILDLMLPGEDGLSHCRRLRQESAVPVIMLTAMHSDVDRIVGLEIGADDYLTKPFNSRELLARIRAVLRRTGVQPRGAQAREGAVLGFAGWRLDVSSRQLTSPEKLLVHLTAGEFDLLVALADRAPRVLTRDQLLDIARGRSASAFDRSVDVQISRLRRKIETNAKDPALIRTVRGGGYVLSVPVTKQ
jgi:two-component system OmpR family response regulator